MKVYLSTLGLERFLLEEPHTHRGDDYEFFLTLEASNHFDYLYRHYVMNSH